MSDYQSINLEENREDKPLHEMAHLLIENAQPYPAGGFGEDLLEMGFSYLPLSVEQRESDLTLHFYKDANKGKMLEYVSEYLGVDLNNITVFGDQANDKEMFEKALEITKLKASEAVYIGDSYNKDMQSAKSVGMRAFLIGHKDIQDPEVTCIDTLLDVFEYL